MGQKALTIDPYEQLRAYFYEKLCICFEILHINSFSLQNTSASESYRTLLIETESVKKFHRKVVCYLMSSNSFGVHAMSRCHILSP